jgi:hypothetical protein
MADLARSDVTTQSEFPVRWWTMLTDGRIDCRLCPRLTKLNEGQRDFCIDNVVNTWSTFERRYRRCGSILWRALKP